MLRYQPRFLNLIMRHTHNIFPLTLLLASFFLALAVPRAPAAAQDVAHGFPHALLYVTNSRSSLDSLRAHINAMDIIAPQTYAATSTGKLLGTPRAEVLTLAQDAGAQVMPLVVNQNFCQKCVHTFLKNDTAQNKLLTSLIAEAKKRGYIGFQYDFEHMSASDKDLYSAFVAKSAPILHGAGLQFSVAVAPKHSDLAADYGKGSWENWTGAFDYQAIGASADFISVMAYDDSKSVGPAAALPWVESVMNYALARVPSDKISLGVAFYAWIRNNKTGKIDHIVGYPSVAALFNSNTPITAAGWSDELGSSYVSYKKGSKSLTAWYEDQKSFQQKLALVTNNHLRGFSAWALGQEDPMDWTHITALTAGGAGLAVR